MFFLFVSTKMDGTSEQYNTATNNTCFSKYNLFIHLSIQHHCFKTIL